MRKVILIITVLGIASHCNSQGWFQLTSSTGSTLYSVFFPPSGAGNIGYAAGASGIIIFTSNAGSNWALQQSQTGNDLQSIYFVSAQTGWAAGSSGTVIRTTNGGLNWSLQSAPTSEILYSVFFINQFTGWAVGAAGVILNSSNSGSNWFFQNSGSGDYLRSVYFVNTSSGTAVGRNGKIIRTSNGGMNWTDVSPGLSSTLYSVFYTNSSTGWAVGFGSLMTTNSGMNWVLQSGPGLYLSVFFPSLNTGWRSGIGGVIEATTNSGSSWSPQASGTANWLFSVHFTSNSTGYIAGENGLLLKTTNGGGLFTGIEPVSNEIPERFSLSQNYPNPFNPTTSIEFGIVKNGFVNLTVFDALGREVETLVNQQLQPGFYRVGWDAVSYPSGIYFYRLTAADPSAHGDLYRDSKRMILLK